MFTEKKSPLTIAEAAANTTQIPSRFEKALVGTQSNS
jgi:hypothetical protein